MDICNGNESRADGPLVNYPQAPQPYYPYPMQPAPQNGTGTAGLVLGILALVFCWIPFVGVIAWPLSIVGVSLSYVGVSKADKGQVTNKGSAVAGAVMSIIALAVCAIWLVLTFA